MYIIIGFSILTMVFAYLTINISKVTDDNRFAPLMIVFLIFTFISMTITGTVIMDTWNITVDQPSTNCAFCDGRFVNTDGNATINIPYGEVWYHNHTATTINFAVDGLYYNLTFAYSKVNGFTNSTHNLTAQIKGRYKVCYMASGSGINNHEYHTTVTINNIVQDNLEAHNRLNATGDILTMSGCGFIDLNVGDAVGLATADIGGTGNGNYYSNNLNLIRIGDI